MVNISSRHWAKVYGSGAVGQEAMDARSSPIITVAYFYNPLFYNDIFWIQPDAVVANPTSENSSLLVLRAAIKLRIISALFPAQSER